MSAQLRESGGGRRVGSLGLNSPAPRGEALLPEGGIFGLWCQVFPTVSREQTFFRDENPDYLGFLQVLKRAVRGMNHGV